MPEVIEFTKSIFSIYENGTSIEPIAVRRSGNGTGVVTVKVSLKSESATVGKGKDIAPLSQVITWNAGDLRDKLVNVQAIADLYDEGTETCRVSLSSLKGASYGALKVAQLAIVEAKNFQTEINDTDLIKIVRNDANAVIPFSVIREAVNVQTVPQLTNFILPTDLVLIQRQSVPYLVRANLFTLAPIDNTQPMLFEWQDNNSVDIFAYLRSSGNPITTGLIEITADSFYPQTPPSNLVDGNTNTNWDAVGIGTHWLQVDFKNRPAKINRFILCQTAWLGKLAEFIPNLIVEASNEGTTWDVLTTIANPTDPETNIVLENDTFYRFYRWRQQLPRYFNMGEIKVFGTY
jgi:hypothetical protein